MLTAALYLRVSTEDQARHGYSLAAQAEACEARARALGATDILRFTDEGVSGALLSRPGLDGLRAAVRARAVEIVVVWDPDRLSRNLSHQLLLTEEIERARIRLEFVNFEWKNTAEGQLFYAMRGAIAQYEKEKIRERTSRGRLQKAKQGKLPLAFRPYGYDYRSGEATLVPIPGEAQVVRDIFRWLVEEGEGPNGIARRLNTLGIPAKKGGGWHRVVVRQILTNPVYIGLFQANRWDTSGCSLNRHRPRGERVRASLRPEGEWVEIGVPPLVDQQTWDRAQELLAGARRLWAGKGRAAYLLSGLLTCGTCGMSMSGYAAREWGRRRRRYTCRRSYTGAPGGWCGRSVPAEPVEEAVWDLVAGWLGFDPEALQDLLGDQEQNTARDRERAEVAEAITQAERARLNIRTLLEQGLLDADEAASSLRRIQERLNRLAERQTELTAAAPEPSHSDLTEPLERLRSGDLPHVERRRILRALIRQVTVAHDAQELQVSPRS